jgi:hypothetical protein
VQYADQMLQVLVDIALNGQSETARIVNGILNLTRVCRDRQFQSDPPGVVAFRVLPVIMERRLGCAEKFFRLGVFGFRANRGAT